jgi:hypothetical protein
MSCFVRMDGVERVESVRQSVRQSVTRRLTRVPWLCMDIQAPGLSARCVQAKPSSDLSHEVDGAWSLLLPFETWDSGGWGIVVSDCNSCQL